ncbi:MAG: NADPH-dependent assimilatory sulfite reductase hemoprotein subunit [Pirellulales bacterium]
MPDETTITPDTLTTPPKPAAAEKKSPVEVFKLQSHYLGGQIAEELRDGNDFFGKGSIQLLKHHGTYQQDNRELRTAREGQKSLKQFSFMVRSRVPGGKLTAEQLLGEIDLGEELGNSTLRITSRQGLQLHSIPKKHLKECIRRINEIKLGTIAACGDVSRNVMCCPVPHYDDPIHAELQQLADELAAHFKPRTQAYYEIWLRDDATGEETLVGQDGKEVSPEPSGTARPPSSAAPSGAQGNGHAAAATWTLPAGPHAVDPVEPIYGPLYLPRKFKIAVGLSDDNCVDLYANDIGLMAIVEAGKIIGYNVLVGGSMGCTPANKNTFPAIAKRMCFIRPEQAIDVCTAIVKVQRDYGNRADRKLARMKYLIANWGLERFKAKVEEYYGEPLAECDPTDVTGFDDHLGWHEQGDGRYYYGLNVENGRIEDNEHFQLKAAIREICHTLHPGIRLTAHQSLLFTDLPTDALAQLEEILHRHHVKLSHEISEVRRWSMACVAWPTCGLAITEAERALPGIIDQLEPELAKLGLSSERFTLRMTGCPNGCARPYNCDIGLVGKAADRYTLFVGGRLLGDRMNFIYKDLVPGEEVVPSLVPLFLYFKTARLPDETFGDFCQRKGADDLRAWAERYAAQASAEVSGVQAVTA